MTLKGSTLALAACGKATGSDNTDATTWATSTATTTAETIETTMATTEAMGRSPLITTMRTSCLPR